MMDDEYEVIETEDSAITAFCKEGIIDSVCIQAPFFGNVRGVHIGDSIDDVIGVLGKPTGIWKMTLDKEGWFYADEAFMRVDFSIELGNRVKMIYV
ncbi:MAG: hypothetical protein LBS89_01475 [Zoogloeaceae bacterium]|nr:hypothetical protein [Zoogloeaceae bacterium]